MKKIVSAALVGAMVAGAFAADAKITLNYRTKLDAFAYTSAKVGDKKTITKELLDWEGYDGTGKQAATNPSDTFKFVLNGDRAGATFAANINANTSSYALNEYSAWMKWELGPGELKIGSGNWKDGFADGAYRVKKDVDAQNAEGMDFERFKLGTSLKGTTALTFVDDLGGSNSALFSYADYGFQAGDAAKVNVLLGSKYTTYWGPCTEVDGDKTTYSYNDANFVARVQLALEVLNAELIFKKPAVDVVDFAAYFMPKIVDGLTLNIGGAAEINSRDKDDKANPGYTDWAFDLRARYQATDELSITFYTNLSGTNLDAGRKISAGIAGHKGAEGWATAKAVKTAMWNNLSARYKISDALAATLNIGLITPLSKIEGDENKYSPEWRVTPAIQVYAGSNASIWAGVALSGASATISDVDNSVFAVQVPVIFRVKM
jgi:hypothetical protein